jgi:hypothetical protein
MLAPSWCGFFQDFGYHILSTFPEGVPVLIPPEPLPDAQLDDLPVFSDFFSDTLNIPFPQILFI